MWLLNGIIEGKLCYRMLPGQIYSIGKHESNHFVLDDDDDGMVSWKHAMFLCEAEEDNDEDAKVTIRDMSVLGTIINETNKLNNSSVILNEGDLIRFGSNCFRFEKPKFTVTSCIKNVPQLQELKEVIRLLGGCYVDDWNGNVTHLVMTQITLKLKLALALASALPIVTPTYFQDLASSNSGKDFANEKKFLPTVKIEECKSQDDLFCPNKDRMQLMQKKTFISLSKKQFDYVKPVIKRAGGTILIVQSFDGSILRHLKSTKMIALEWNPIDEKNATQPQKEWRLKIKEALQKVNVRMIPESEIFKSVIANSLQKYCNPCVPKGKMESHNVKVIFNDIKNGKKILRSLLEQVQYTLTIAHDHVMIHLSSRKLAKDVSRLLRKDKHIKHADYVMEKAVELATENCDGDKRNNKSYSGAEKNTSSGSVENTVEEIWKNINDETEIALNNHNDKLTEAKQELLRVREMNKKKVKVDEMNINLKLISSQKKIVQELEGQENEFKENMKMMKAAYARLANPNKQLNKLRELALNASIECQRFKAALPIYSKRSEIIQKINDHQVTILTAETGSGKSTQVVQYIHQVGYSTSGLIVCTQPRKVAALSIAKRVAEEMRTKIGDTVGYSVGMNTRKGRETSIMFMTDQVLLNECLRDPLLQRYKCIIIDEAHERSIATDLLLAMVKKALKTRPEMRLIISSATIDPTIFELYFRGLVTKIHVYGRTFPVEIHWEKESKKQSYVTTAVEKVKQVHQKERPGDILVFLTTPIETERAQELINNDCNLKGGVYCLVLHGRLRSEEQQLVFDPAPDGKRKIVFATNSAETSITIPNIRYVIDSGMVKEKHFDAKKNSSSLRIGPISKSSAEQRMGRAGRTQEGKCYRLFTVEEYQEMEDAMLPEILRENLGLALLKLFQFGVEDPLNYDFVESPPKESLELAMRELVKLGAVEDHFLTKRGEKMASLSIEPRLAKFVILGVDGDFPLESLIIAAICSVGGNVFFRAGSDEEKQIADRLKTRFCSQFGDILTLLEVYKEWMTVDDHSKNKWCVSNSMNAKTLRFTRELVNEMKGNLEKFCGIKVDDEFNDIGIVSNKVPKILFRCFERNLAYYSGHLRGGYYRLGDAEECYFIHPSSALSFLSVSPAWVLFEEVLTTARPYLINVTVVPDEIGRRLGRNDDTVVKIVHRRTVGKETANRLGLGRHNGRLEVNMRECIRVKIFIDLDENIGEATLYTVSLAADDATSLFDEAINKELGRSRERILELPISDGNPYSLIIGQGGEAKEMLSPGEYTSVLVCNLKLDGKNQIAAVERRFSRFGQISDIIKFKDGSFYWGKIVFTSHATAHDAVRRGDLLDDEYSGDEEDRVQVKPDVKGKQQAMKNQVFRIRASWTRREGKGFAFLSIDDDELRSYLLLAGHVGVGNDSYHFSRSKKNVTDVRVTGIDRYYSNDQIKAAIESQLPSLIITKCVVPRADIDIESADVVTALQRQLRMKVNQILSADDENNASFTVLVYPTRNAKDHDFRGVLSFQKITDGQKVLRNNISIGAAMVRFTPELQCAVNMKQTIYQLYEADITAFQENAAGYEVKIGERQYRREKMKDISISSKSIEFLAAARQQLQEITRGVSIKCSERSFRFYNTPMGRQFIESIKKEVPCIVEIDRRSNTIVGYVPKEHSDKFLLRFKRQNAQVKDDEEVLNIYLSKESYPRGFIKLLLERFGVKFEELYRQSKVNYIGMNFFKHNLEIYGTQESLVICCGLIKKLACETEEADADDDEIRTCPICFDTLSSTSYQLESCCHSYCKECIDNMCQHAVKNNNLPIMCAHEDCENRIGITDINKFVETEDLIAASLDQLIGKNKDDYAYCITPNCTMVYKKSHQPDAEPFQCPVCQHLICTFCCVEHHVNISCAMNKGDNEDESIKIWLSEAGKDRGICPKCTAPIERFEGCLHMTCLICKKHVCWKCKKAYFERAEHCYDHMCVCQPN